MQVQQQQATGTGQLTLPWIPTALQGLQLGELQRQIELATKLNLLFQAVAGKFTSGICVCQAWLPLLAPDVSAPAECTAGGTAGPDMLLYVDPSLSVIGEPCFQEFRLKSCQTPLLFKNSMPGRVWRSGAVAVIQSLRIIPTSLHPRSQLKEEDLDRLADVLYIPVFDVLRPEKGTVTVLEVFCSAKSPESMLAADFISYVGQVLATLSLSVSNPVPQPIRRSALCGRRARAQDDSDPDMQQQPSPPAAVQPPQPATSAPAAAMGGADSPGSSSNGAQQRQELQVQGGAGDAKQSGKQGSAHCQQQHARTSGCSKPQEGGVYADGTRSCGQHCQSDHEAFGEHEVPRKVRKVGGIMRSKSMHAVTAAACQPARAAATLPAVMQTQIGAISDPTLKR